MQSRSASVLGVLILALSLTGCATAAGGAGIAAPGGVIEPVETNEPAASASTDAAAREQAQTWLDAAELPPGAVRADAGAARFASFTGWPCGPVEELEAFWTIPGASVRDTAEWLMDHPTADLMSTAVGPVPDDPAIESAIVGYIPTPDSQEGIVYTIAKTDDGVAVRAEIAALTESATCPTLPDGGTYGQPGQG